MAIKFSVEDFYSRVFNYRRDFFTIAKNAKLKTTKLSTMSYV